VLRIGIVESQVGVAGDTRGGGRLKTLCSHPRPNVSLSTIVPLAFHGKISGGDVGRNGDSAGYAAVVMPGARYVCPPDR